MASTAGVSRANPVVASEEGEVQPSPLLSGYYASSEGSEGYLTGPEEGESSRVVAAPAPLLPGEAAAAAVWSLAFGSVSQRGLDQRKGMEDTVSLRPFFCVQADGSPMHFFAVFNGHGGPQVSALCSDQMHVILAEELARVATAYRKEHLENDEEAERQLRVGGHTGDGVVRIGVAHHGVHCRGGVPGPRQHPRGQLRRLPPCSAAPATPYHSPRTTR
ncbi:unnamed protein product [Triticum turgidum subsp. durum]|uniref:protein-serine/threonine phosphatase n=1 Tax=Triticum turgidum subsp. durum TaxID=4567 RepID=A0A9R0Z318_TRITD|nr:unnamed protein product [Triticum turgidum subsp. durum]